MKLTCLLIWIATTVAMTPRISAQELPTQKVLTIDVAQAMAQEAMFQCRAKGYKITVTIVDSGNELKALLRDDGAGLGSVQIGRMKTNSVMHFGFPPGPPAANPPPGTATPVPMSDSVFAKGGMPIKVGDDLIGAISVSGAHKTPIAQRPAWRRLPTSSSRIAILTWMARSRKPRTMPRESV